MKTRLLALAAATALLPASLLAQTGTGTATIHGHIQNPAGFPIKGAKVLLTKDKTAEPANQKMAYTFPANEQGDYKGADIAPGDYLAIVDADGKHIDYAEVTVKGGDDKLVDFDMTRAEFIAKMSPEEKKQLEEYKKSAGAAMAANKVVANINATMKAVTEDLKSPTPHYDQDIQQMQQASQAKPDEAVVWYNLAQAQMAKAEADAKAGKSQGKLPSSDATLKQEYTDAIASFKKGVEANAAAKKPNPADAGIAWNSVGNMDAKIGDLTASQEAFDNAVKLAPASAGMVYGNEAAVLFNAGHAEEAAAAADKAIAADPNRADAYYIKGQYLIQKASVDKSGKVVPAPGTIEAYNKFLELTPPENPRAQEVKALLESMGQTIQTKYKAPGKR